MEIKTSIINSKYFDVELQIGTETHEKRIVLLDKAGKVIMDWWTKIDCQQCGDIFMSLFELPNLTDKELVIRLAGELGYEECSWISHLTMEDTFNLIEEYGSECIHFFGDYAIIRK